MRELLAHKSPSNPSIAQADRDDDFDEVTQGESSKALVDPSLTLPMIAKVFMCFIII